MTYYGPDEPAATIFLERTFLAGDFISGMGFGILTVMYIATTLLLYRQRKRKRDTFFLLGYITLLYTTLIIFVSVSAGTVQMIYIDNRNYPGGPWKYFLDTQNLAINVIFISTFFLLTFFADSLLLWRCWIIWSASGIQSAWIGIAFPAVLLLASFVMGIFWVLQSSSPGLSLYSHLPLAFGTSYYALSIGMNVVITFLIIGRLLAYRKRIISSGATEQGVYYTSLVSIIIESASLYSVFAILFLSTYGANNPINQIFLGFTSIAQQISAFLIIYRLAEGKAWKKNTLEQQVFSTMQFGVTRDLHGRSTLPTVTIDTTNNGSTTEGSHITSPTTAVKEDSEIPKEIP